MSFQYLNDTDGMADLVSQMQTDDQAVFNSYGHMRVEAVFDKRIFFVYKSKGQGAAPEMLGTIKVLDYECSSESGSSVEIEDVETGQRQVITHVPSRVFDYNLFMSVPQALRLRWDARVHPVTHKLVRSLSYALLVKSQSRSDQFTPHATYIETFNRFREMYPDLAPKLPYV